MDTTTPIATTPTAAPTIAPTQVEPQPAAWETTLPAKLPMFITTKRKDLIN